jgi:hypothetical protein
MSDLASNSPYIEYGTRPFLAILFSLFLAGFAIFSSLYCVQPMMPIFAIIFMSVRHIAVSLYLFLLLLSNRAAFHWFDFRSIRP